MANENDRRPLASRNTGWQVGLTKWLAKTSVTPNHISIFSVVTAAIGAGSFLISGQSEGALRIAALLSGALFVQIRLLCNLLDGMVAVEAGIRLSINISVLSIQDSGWLAILESACSNVCQRLIIEITEGAAMSDVEMTTAFMHRSAANTAASRWMISEPAQLPSDISKTSGSTSLKSTDYSSEIFVTIKTTRYWFRP